MARPYTRISLIYALRPRNVYGGLEAVFHTDTTSIDRAAHTTPLQSSMADEEDVRYDADAGLPPVIRQSAVGVKNQTPSSGSSSTAKRSQEEWKGCVLEQTRAVH